MCNQPDEETHHVLQCPEASHKWNRGITALAETLASTGTDQLLSKGLIQLLKLWHNDTPMSGWDVRTSPCLRKALEAQLTLGGWNTVMGRLSKQLSDWQANHFKHTKSHRSGHRWMVAIIKKLQEVAWYMW